jgi:hypothetical protein
MRQNVLFFLMLLVCGTLSGQVTDNFSDGDFVKDPVWIGDTVDFEINSSQQLHLTAAGADTSVLVTANQLYQETEWHFGIKMSFNTSVNNYARVYLTSDRSDLKGPVKGYYLQLGGSNDSIALMKQDGTATIKLINALSATTGNSTNSLGIRVVHDSAGTWLLSIDPTGGNNYIPEGQCSDNSVSGSGWFGVFCKYTASNSSKFYFDNFYVGSIQTDTIPPAVSLIHIANEYTMTLAFSEAVLKNEAETISHYRCRALGLPNIAKQDSSDGRVVRLNYSSPFPDDLLDTLEIKGIPDNAGNVMKDTSVVVTNHLIKTFDIVIAEIMADPDPVQGLPECEYVKLYNRTKFPVNLAGWTFDAGSTRKTIPEVTVVAHGFVILSKGNVLSHYGNCVDLFTSYSTLSNEGAALVLRNSKGSIIHSVTYSSEWYRDDRKAQGGWSLEMIDPDNPCGCNTNWIASTDRKGGTPGTINSVDSDNRDESVPYMKLARTLSDSTVAIVFSEALDSTGLNENSRWKVSGSGNEILRIRNVAPAYTEIDITLKNQMTGHGIETFACLVPPKDCAGNLLDTGKVVCFGKPDEVLPGDLVINEIMMNPKSGGERFVELYNCSLKILDLKDLMIGTDDPNINASADIENISDESFLLFPEQYAVLTRGSADILSRFTCPYPDAILEMNAFPSFDDDNGQVVIARRNDGQVVESMSYTPEMFSGFLTSHEGISLERLNPKLSAHEATTWHSASEGCGFATPGYRNSEFLPMLPGDREVEVFPQVFTPDGDGKDDLLIISINLNDPDYLANITVFDAKGNLVKSLANNRLLSAPDFVIWDGNDGKSQKCPAGIYIIYIELFSPDGSCTRMKKICVSGGRR